MSFELKAISGGAVPGALEKAERYRLLNDPEQAESICRDVLTVDGRNQDALRLLLLSLTDQFPAADGGAHAREAREVIGRLVGDYDRAYYAGLVHEREARA